MFKTILVPASGSNTDRSVFATALALARPMRGHLQFLHLRPTPEIASRQVAHFEFCQGTAISATLEKLRREGEELALSARQHFDDFCNDNGIRAGEAPVGGEAVSASWTEERLDPLSKLVVHARHSDVTILGRRHRNDRLPPDLIEEVLIGSGRPVVIAAEAPPRDLATIVVGWKEAPEAARALAAALPLLKQAQKVVLVSVAEEESPAKEALSGLAQRLARQGIRATTCSVGSGSSPAAALLPRTAVELSADLLVVGAFGRTPLRESLFGGVTSALIDGAPLAVFMVH